MLIFIFTKFPILWVILHQFQDLFDWFMPSKILYTFLKSILTFECVIQVTILHINPACSKILEQQNTPAECTWNSRCTADYRSIQPHTDIQLVWRVFSVSLGTLNYVWNSFWEVRIPGTQFKTQGRCSFGTDSSLTWGLHVACMTSWQMRKVRGILLKDWSEVSKQGREMDSFVVASEVNGKCPCFAEHNSLNKRWSKVA